MMSSVLNGKKAFILGAALAVFAAGAVCGEEKAKLEDLVVSNVNVAAVRDGTYEGEQLTKLVTARVEVVVASGSLVSIKVLNHRHGPFHGADAIADRVVLAQSLEVDGVSGATMSSKVMLKAIENALEKGL